jgi:hypothetical protein
MLGGAAGLAGWGAAQQHDIAADLVPGLARVIARRGIDLISATVRLDSSRVLSASHRSTSSAVRSSGLRVLRAGDHVLLGDAAFCRDGDRIAAGEPIVGDGRARFGAAFVMVADQLLERSRASVLVRPAALRTMRLPAGV